MSCRREGFLGFGGGHTTQTVKTNIYTDIATSVVAKSIQSCASFADVKQELRVQGSSYVVMDGISMDQKFSVTIQCAQDQKQMTEIQNQITNKLMQSGHQTNQAVLGAVNSLFDEKNDQNLSTNVSTLIKNDINVELIQKITNQVNQVQSFVVKDSDHVIFKHVAMQQVSNAILDITQKSIQQTKLAIAMQNQTDQDATQEMRNPIADTLTAYGGMMKDIFAGLGNLMSGPLFTILLIIIALMIVGMVLKKFMGGGGDNDNGDDYDSGDYDQASDYAYDEL